MVAVDVHILGRNVFFENMVWTVKISQYIFPFFDGWDFPAVSTLERGKRRRANTIAIHEREAMSAEELINLQDSYTGAS